MNNVQKTPTRVKGRRVRCVLVEGGGPVIWVELPEADHGISPGSVTPANAPTQAEVLGAIWSGAPGAHPAPPSCDGANTDIEAIDNVLVP